MKRFLLAATVGLIACLARADQDIYTDQLDNGWQSWSWATVNLANTSPVHTGTRSVSVTAAAWQALYLHHNAFSSSSYQGVRFWIHGGALGGQRVQIQGLLGGAAQPAVQLNPLPAGQWRLIEIPLSTLGVDNKPNLDGFWIQDVTGTAQPTWFVDDFSLVSAGPPAQLQVQVNTTQLGQTIDTRMFGVNAAVWDSSFGNQATTNLLNEAGNTTLRFPGGSLSDEYHWATNTTGTNTWQWATSFDSFATVALGNQAQVFITANYGTGTPQEAAAWVNYSNNVKGYGFKYWEIGNENYGSWEADNRPRPHDPYIYANEAQLYIQQMKAADPTIKVGVVVIDGEDSFANYSDRVVTNPRTGQQHSGWTPVMLSRLRQLGVTPDYVIYHKYAQAPFSENDEGLLNSASTWASDIEGLRQQVNDYLGTNGANVEIVCTENNSVYTQPGKQTTSLVNGLFFADSLGQALQTELKSLVWWDLRNGQETGNNNSVSLYGWRQYGDYGMVSYQNDRYPVFYVKKLLQHFVRGGDIVLPATSNYAGLAAYSVKKPNGDVNLLLINKTPSLTLNPSIALSGITPYPQAIRYSYGIPQDEAARTGTGSPDVQQSTLVLSGSTFSLNLAPYSATVLKVSPNGLPPAPSNLFATAVSQTLVQLGWNDTSLNETGFAVEVKYPGKNWQLLLTTQPNTVTTKHGRLRRGQTYVYRVRAFNGFGYSGYSNEVSVTTFP